MDNDKTKITFEKNIIFNELDNTVKTSGFIIIENDKNFVHIGNLFCKAHNSFIIKYKKVGGLPFTKGLNYIHILLQHPNENLLFIKLLFAAGEITSNDNLPNYDKTSFPDLSYEDLSTDDKSKVVSLINELKMQLKEAINMKDNFRADKLKQEIEFCIEWRNKVQKPHNPQAKREIDNISKAITAAIKSISIVDPELSVHLSESIKTGRLFSYNPVKKTDWNFNLPPEFKKFD